MNKAILVGNGFTSNLIKDYQNSIMMERLIPLIKNEYSLANSFFDNFRIPTEKDQKVYKYGGGLRCGSGIVCGEGVYTSSDSIIYNEKTRRFVINKLEELNFSEPIQVFNDFFIKYGLIFETNQTYITNIESLLKVVSLLTLIEKIELAAENNIEKIANEVYYNNGHYGLVDTILLDYHKVKSFFSQFEKIFTTNYDLVLDDICEGEDKVFHLHGGFNIEHRNLKSNKRLDNKNAFLVWGKDGKDKLKKFRGGTDFSDVRFDAFRFGQSLLDKYFDLLENERYSELHIFGYSGENDQHINERILRNGHLKQIFFYCNPGSELDDYDFQCKVKDLFKSEKIKIDFIPWTEIWDKIL